MKSYCIKLYLSTSLDYNFFLENKSLLMTYRKITVGEALNESLKEFESQITEELASKIIASYNVVMQQKFNEYNTQAKVKLMG